MQSAASSSILSKKKPTVSVEDASEDDDIIREEADLEQEEFASEEDLAGEDRDGRFFGGGLTEEQTNILNIFESAEGESAGVSLFPYVTQTPF
jgi:beta-catenin-like protein 1